MIKTPLTKILFLDIETVGGCKDYKSCKDTNPQVAKQFIKYIDWFQKRFPEDSQLSLDEIFLKRTSLIPEFAKIVCVSVAFVTDKDEVKIQSFSGDDEKQLLKDCQKLLERCGKLDFYLCGHNLKNFDIPMLAKRMIINGIMPPSILPSYDTKPWEIKAIDTKEIWQYGAYTSIGSLDLLCSTMDIPTSKEGDISGENVHFTYWNENKLQENTEYCEKDVKKLNHNIKKFKNLEK